MRLSGAEDLRPGTPCRPSALRARTCQGVLRRGRGHPASPSAASSSLFATCLGLGLACGLLLLDSLDEGQELLTQHKGSQGPRHADTVRLLVILDQAAQCTLGCTKGAVEHVAEGVLFLEATFGAHRPGLIVQTIRARYKLPVLTLALVIAREPTLKVVFLGRGIVQLTRHDRNSPVRDTQGLVELLCQVDHLVVLLPRLLGLDESKLLDLLKLVHTEDPTDVATAAAGLAAEARGHANVTLREILPVDVLSFVEG
mmetsp:Transcript_103210/g.258772  ORF Transcript_103210/g.258772 Transcript_103210/m.258772 type:complete len:256 (+) Transcript_103210:162-929(+)